MAAPVDKLRLHPMNLERAKAFLQQILRLPRPQKKDTHGMNPEKGEEIEETPELIVTCLQKLKSLISEEGSYSCPKDDKFLLKFLRARKYDVDATALTIQKYFKVKRDFPDIFEGFLPSDMLYDAICRKGKLAAVSRHRDSCGRGVGIFRTGPWDPSICTMSEFIRASLILVEWLILDEEVQKEGIVFVLDYKGLGLRHFMHLTPFVMKKLVHITEKCYPVRVKAIYVINDSPVFDLLFAITRPFMSGKLVQRVQLIGYELSKLLDLVPADIIPEEAGGTFESYDYDALERDLLSRNDYFREVSQYGYGKKSTHI